ncbi:uncharacterized oxidoreductase dhs-27-like [Ostrinia nubilalis]|uniref:uncharacterized oxidoreductase dhs-27-like n=1 Tax=Ostrinia nubilalis TaxID=29057 RepID=UPI0030824500
MSLDVNISEPEEFDCVELHTCLKSVAERLGIGNFEYHVDYISGGRENFVANIFRVVIRDTDKNEIQSVIVKTLVNTTRQELFHDIHKREVTVYNVILPRFKEVQEKIDAEKRVLLPECLYSNADRSKEIIILRDLGESGFVGDDTLAEFKELNLNQVQLILTELAKFHALSFVLENQDYENYCKIKLKFEDILYQENFLCKSKLRNYFFESYDMSVNLVTDSEARKKLVKARPKLLELLKMYNQPSKHSVLCHGDLWVNNMLFKKESDHSKICFIDFQAMRCASPATDIVYFMYLCTTSKFRSEHFKQLQFDYYDTLNSTLKDYDIDVNSVYPRDEFEKDVRENLPLGLLIALVELRILTLTPEDEAVMKGNANIPGWDWIPGEVELYKYRVNDVVDESVENGVLELLMSKVNT